MASCKQRNVKGNSMKAPGRTTGLHAGGTAQSPTAGGSPDRAQASGSPRVKHTPQGARGNASKPPVLSDVRAGIHGTDTTSPRKKHSSRGATSTASPSRPDHPQGAKNAASSVDQGSPREARGGTARSPAGIRSPAASTVSPQKEQNVNDVGKEAASKSPGENDAPRGTAVSTEASSKSSAPRLARSARSPGNAGDPESVRGSRVLRSTSRTAGAGSTPRKKAYARKSPRRRATSKSPVIESGGSRSTKGGSPQSANKGRGGSAAVPAVGQIGQSASLSSPVTASTDDSLLGYPEGQELVPLENTPTQTSLELVMGGRHRDQQHQRRSRSPDSSGANFQDRVLRGLKSVSVHRSVKKEPASKKPTLRRPSEVLQPDYPLTLCEVCTAALVVALVTGGVLLWRHRRAEPQARHIDGEGESGKDVIRCEADSCGKLQEILETSMDRSSDPCQDMHQYVCGNWQRHHPGLSVRLYTQVRAVSVFVQGAAQRRAGRVYAGLAGQAALVFDACEDVVLRGDRDIEAIAQVLREANLTWPHVPERMDLLDALLYMDETLHWAVLFDFERVPSQQTDCHHQSKFSADRNHRAKSKGSEEEDYVVRVSVAKFFIPLYNRVREMMQKNRFNSYFELLFLSLVNRTQEPAPSPGLTKFVEYKVIPQLASAANTTRSVAMCTTTSDLSDVTPWLASNQWQSSLSRRFQFEPDAPVVMEITCPELFTTFFDLKRKLTGQKVERPELVANQAVSWYALQTCVMFSYAPAIELMYGSHTAAVENQVDACLYLSMWFSGTANSFVSLPRYSAEDVYWHTRSIVNRVTDSFLSEFIGTKWRETSVIGSKLLTRNRLAISLLRKAAITTTGWATFYSPDRPFVLVWKWAAEKRLPRSFWKYSCCIRQTAASAFVSVPTECCGMLRLLVDTSEWGALPWEDIDSDTRKGTQPYLVQPLAWNMPIFAPDLQLAAKYGALGSLLAVVIAANYFEAINGREYEARLETLTTCLNSTELVSAAEASRVSFASVVRSLALRNASLEALYTAYRAAWEEDRDLEASTENTSRKRRSEDRLFFVFWCLMVCGEPGARELCNEPLKSGAKFARGNFTSSFKCKAGAQVTLPSKCAAQ